MPSRMKFLFKLTYLIFLVFLLFVSGCSLKKRAVSLPEALPNHLKKIVVLGFKPALTQGTESGIFRNPVSGAVFDAAPVPPDIIELMTARLHDLIKEKSNFVFISPGRARGVYSSFLSSNEDLSDLEVFQRTGKEFLADAIIVGYVYRWQERKGANYSAERSASVAFDLYLIRSDDKVILWKGKFDKTQRSLSENILEMASFLKGKGRWMTASELAELGLEEMLIE